MGPTQVHEAVQAAPHGQDVHVLRLTTTLKRVGAANQVTAIRTCVLGLVILVMETPVSPVSHWMGLAGIVLLLWQYALPRHGELTLQRVCAR